MNKRKAVPTWRRILANMAMVRNYRRNLRWFKPREDDIIVAGYPGSGLTWLQWALIQLTREEEIALDQLEKVSPSLDFYLMYEEPELGSFASPRILRSHLPYAQMPHGRCPYIYLARDGRDVAVTQFRRNFPEKSAKQEFRDWFPRFLKGRVRYRSWYRHVCDWYQNKHQRHLLFLTYEELRKDGAQSLDRIAQHLGLPMDETRLNRVLQRTSPEFMRQHGGHRPNNGPNEAATAEATRHQDFVHVQDGSGWSDYFDQDLIQAHDQKCQSTFAGSGLDPSVLHASP